MGLNSNSQERIQEIANTFIDHYSFVISEPKKQFQIGDKVEVISDTCSKGLQGTITRIIGDQYQIDGSRVFVAKALELIKAADTENKEENMLEVKKPVTVGILYMWYNKSIDLVKNKAKSEREELISKDPIKCMFDEKAKEMEDWAKKNLGDMYVKMSILMRFTSSKTFEELVKEGWNDEYLTEDTKALLEVLDQKRKHKCNALFEKKTEVETMLQGCQHPDEEWEVLIGYGIVNDNMTLNVEHKGCYCKKAEE